MSYYPFSEQPTSSYRTLDSGEYELVVRQQPKEALVTLPGKEKNRKPIDPPPIIELKVSPSADPTRQFLQSPYLFMQCSFQTDSGDETPQATPESITGQTVSSLHRLKDINNEDGGFFVFGDISARLLGRHRLNFSLFELRKETGEVAFLKSIISAPFDVVQPKQWRGLEESTHLSRTFSDQGVRLRLRKENRGTAGQKRGYVYTSPQNTAPARPSTASVEQPASGTIYGGTHSVGSHYGGYSEAPPKKPRSDDYGPPPSQPFQSSGRGLPSYDARAGAAHMQPGYPVQTTGSHQSSQTVYGMQTPGANLNWQPQYYTQGSSSAPARAMDNNVRSAQGPAPSFGLLPAVLGADAGETYARRGTDPYPSLQQPMAQTSPTAAYQNVSDSSIYSPQGSASMAAPTTFIDSESTAMVRQHTHHTQSAESPTSSTRSANNPAAPVFIQPSLQPSLQPSQNYGSFPGPSYQPYTPPAQSYRPSSSYTPSTSLLQQPLTNPHAAMPLRPQQPDDPYAQQQSHQYPELGQYQQGPGTGSYPTSQEDRPSWH